MYSNWVRETETQRVHNQLMRDIISGRLPGGTALPPRRILEERCAASPDTLKAVLKRLAAEGYLHSRSRRSALVNVKLPKRHHTIAVLSKLPAEEFASFNYASSAWSWSIYKAISMALLTRGHSSLLLPATELGERFQAMVDGIVTIDTDKRTRALIADTGKPSVYVFDYTQPVNAVTVDRADAMTKSALYFLTQGVRTIASIGFISGGRPETARFLNDHFYPVLREHGMTDGSFRQLPGDYNRSEGEEAMQQILATKPELPLGVITTGDWLAKGALDVAVAAGLRIKKDIFVVAGTGLAETANWSPALTVAGTPFEELGEAAADMIIRIIESGEAQTATPIQSKLIIREC